jgi:hypothetical protein
MNSRSREVRRRVTTHCWVLIIWYAKIYSSIWVVRTYWANTFSVLEQMLFHTLCYSRKGPTDDLKHSRKQDLNAVDPSSLLRVD